MRRERPFNPLVVGSSPTAPIEGTCGDSHSPDWCGVSSSTRPSTRHHDEPTHAHPTDGLLAGCLAVLALFAVMWLFEDTAEAAPYPTLERCALITRTIPRRECIIRSVFRSEGRKAVQVAWCESSLNPEARNGQYRGVFQMGSSERARFGHGRTVLAQARAARRYWRISGWSPWACA